MENSVFAQGLIEVMLSWMRLVALWVWNFFQADMANGFLSWFADHWKSLALTLIVVGLVIDWLIWMIRWRPYWLWLRKRQIVYEEVPVASRKRAPRPQPVRNMPQMTAPQSDFDDPFAENEQDPYAAAPVSKADTDFADWDSDSDPYASDPRHTDYDPSIYGRPEMGEKTDARPQRHLPVFGEKKR